MEVSRFFGIVIAIDGTLSPRARGLILEWWTLHREQLAENWRLAKAGKARP